MAPTNQITIVTKRNISLKPEVPSSGFYFLNQPPSSIYRCTPHAIRNEKKSTEILKIDQL